MNIPLIRICVAISTLGVAAGCFAQAAPSTEQMIEQLKPSRTRSLRNLTIEAAPPPPAATAPAAAGAAGAAGTLGTPGITAGQGTGGPAAAAPGSTAATGQGPAASPAAPAVAPAPAVAAANPAAAASTAAVTRPSLSLLIQFDFNSATVRPESQQALANLARALKSSDLAEFKFAVEGHTDAKGRADYNQRLSQSRAEAVRSYLASEGVDPSRLYASGKGSSDLANPAQPFAAENRRVRIVNLD